MKRTEPKEGGVGANINKKTITIPTI